MKKAGKTLLYPRRKSFGKVLRDLKDDEYICSHHCCL